MAEKFSIDAKLKITGVDVKGDLDAGTLKFKVDTSALKKLVTDAGEAAKKVKSKMDNIKLNKLKIEVNKNSLRSVESQIRNAVQNAVSKTKVDITANVTGGTKTDPFKAQRQAASRSAQSLTTLHELTKSVNQGLRSLVRTLGTVGGSGGAGAGGKAGSDIQNLLPQGTRSVSVANLGTQLNDGGMVTRREADLAKLEKRLDQVTAKEKRLASQVAKGAGFGGAPGGFGGPPGGGSGGKFPGAGGGGNFGKSSVTELGQAMSQLGKNTQNANSHMVNLQELTEQVGRKAAVFRGVAIAINTVVTASQAAAKFLIEFSDALVEINKILQLTDSGMAALGNELFALTAKTGVAISETQSIAEAFARAGLSGRGYGTVVELTDRALVGLQGTTLETAQVTQIMIQVIQQIEGQVRGLSSELITTTKLFDVLGKAEDTTASKASDVAQALKRSAASLFATGATIEEVTTIISVLQERTQRGGDVVGTALKTMASRISSSTSEASKALAGIGVATTDSEGKLRNFFDVLRDTSVAFRQLNETEQANIGVKVAGIRQIEIFRAALQDFNRLQDVNNQLINASGDAQRKQAAEQSKLVNIIARMQAGLQQLVKTAGEGPLGDIFVGAIKLAEKLVTTVSDVDKAFGGAISTFGGFVIGATALKVILQVGKGILGTFKFFTGMQQQTVTGFSQMQAGASNVGSSVEAKINSSMMRTASIMNTLNADMKQFALETEHAAAQAERVAAAAAVAAARPQAQFATGGGDMGGRDSSGNSIFASANASRDPRGAALLAAAGRGQQGQLAQAAKQFPELFTESERKGIENLNKGMAKGSKILGKVERGFDKTAGALKKLSKSTFAWGIAISAVTGVMNNAASSLRKEAGGTSLAADALDVGAGAAQGAIAGAFLGSIVPGLGNAAGAVIGGVAGAAGSLTTVLMNNKDTISLLERQYISLGIIQTKNGEITSEVSQKLQKALANVEGFKDINLKAVEREQQELADPKKAAENEKKLARAREQATASLRVEGGGSADRILQALSKQLQARTGVEGLDLSDPSLRKKGAAALTEVDENALSLLEEEAIALAESMGGNVAQVREIFEQSAANIRNSPIDLTQIKLLREDLAQEVALFTQALGQEILPDAKDFGGKNAPFRKALGEIATNNTSKTTESALKTARQQSLQGIGPRGETGEAVSLKEIDALIAQAKSFSEQASNIGATGPGRALPEILAKLPASLADAIKKSVEEGVRRGNQEAAGALFALIRRPATSVNKPINQLENSFRSFIADFGREVIKLNETQLRAMTPQRELADKLALNARAAADAARANVDIGGGDALAVAREEFAKISGLNAKVSEGSDRTVGDAATELFDAMVASARRIRDEGITDPGRKRSAFVEGTSQVDLAGLTPEKIKKVRDIADKFATTLTKLKTESFSAVIKSNSAQVSALKKRFSEENKQLTLDARRREIISLNTSAMQQELTGMRALAAERQSSLSKTEASIAAQREVVQKRDEEISALKALISAGSDVVANTDLLAATEERSTQQSLKLEELLAQERIASIRHTISVAREAIDVTSRLAEGERSRVASMAEIGSILVVNEKQLAGFNRKLKDTGDQFKITQAELAAEAAVVNATISDETEKTARLSEIKKKATAAALEQAKAEAEVIAERRDAVKQVTQDLLGNQQEQVNAQGAVIEATKRVSEAFDQYLTSVDGAILATTRYNLGLQLAEVQGMRVTGSFTGLRDELGAVQDTFRSATNLAREMGASENTLVEIRRESINQQLALFNQLLSEQSQLARGFFTSSAEDQASLAQGLQEAQGIASLLGGSFSDFKGKGEQAINDLGAQLLSLPQDVRQRVISSLETLGKVGGSVGGFTSDELLTAIETASLGVSGEGLEVDPLFQVQERIAELNQEQARLATDQLLAANEGVQASKQQLEEAEAAKDLAQIQLDRIKEEGEKLRGNLSELRGDLKTVMLQQDSNTKTGLNMVASAVNRTTEAILTGLPATFSVKIAEALKSALSTGNVGGGESLASSITSTPGSRGAENARDLRRNGGSNVAQANQTANSAGLAPSILTNANDSRTQRSDSNLPNSGDTKESNQTLKLIVDELMKLNVSNSALETAIAEAGTTSSSVTSAAATTAIPDINVNIEGQQRITVTGFETGVARITQALNDTFGGFVDETQARNIANEVVDSIKTALLRVGIIQPNS